MAPLGGSAGAAVCFYLLTFAVPLPVDIGLLGLAVLGSWTALTTAARFPPGTFLALLPLGAALGMGNLISPDPARSLHLTLALLPAGAVYLLICGYFGQRQLACLCLTLALLCCAMGGWLLAVAAAHPGLPPGDWIRQSRLTAFKVPNDVVLFPILLPFPLALFQSSPASTPRRWLALAAVGATLLLAVVYRSRLAVLVTGVSVVTYLTLVRETRHLPRAALALTAGLIIADAALGFGLATKFIHSWTSRLPLWLAAWRMFLESPLTGHGIGSYVYLYRDQLDSIELPGWIVFDPRLTPWAHNLYLEILAELGLTGLFAFAVLVFFGFTSRRSRDPRQRVITSAAPAALVAFCIAGLFELSLWRQWVGLTFMLIISCIVATNQQEGKS